MSVLPVGFGSSGGVDTGDIGHSLRFRSAATPLISRTFGTPTNQSTFTFSCFIKRGTLGSIQGILVENAGNQWGVVFQANDTIGLYVNSSVVGATTAVYRDTTAPIHFVWQQSGTAHKFFVNNVEVASFTATQARINSAILHGIGRNASAGSLPFDGYLSRIAFVDGTALTPSSFGYLNTEINEWVTKSQSAVKAVVDAGGTNSFMLDFDDATSLTTLGYDKSSKGNNWTLNNFSLTAGTTYDHMLDVPGNSFATLNPLATFTSGTASEGNLKLTTGTTHCFWEGSIGASSGKWYWETTDIADTPGIITGIARTDTVTSGGDLGDKATGYGYQQTGNKKNNGSSTSYGATFTVNDVIGVALDLDAGELTFYKNGTTQGIAFSSLSGSYVPAMGDTANASGGGIWACNFGQAPLHASATYDSASGGYFRYTPPTGFKALCQANLPDPAILNPKAHFDIKTRTGVASSDQSVTGLLFQPDMAWVKCRSSAYSNNIFDSVRGVGQTHKLLTDLTEVEGGANAQYGNVKSFDATGYTLNKGTSGVGQQTNSTGDTYVDWLWKAGGAAVSNTAGSITSQVSANVDAGFSIVTYTGNGLTSSGQTIGHGLGKVPTLVITKDRTAPGGGTHSWNVKHKDLGAGYGIWLEQTAARNPAMWTGDTNFSTTVFSPANLTYDNVNNNTYVAYCFADIEGYSKAFSYTGNGSADGPYVHLGFKPRYILHKCSSAASQWLIWDTVRGTVNPLGTSVELAANAASAEGFGGWGTSIDVTANGFKFRGFDNDNFNSSADTYIGFAIADVAGKYSLAR